MKRIAVAVVAVLLAVGFSVAAMAQETVKVKEKTTVKGDTVTTTVKAKDEATGAKAKQEVVTTSEGTTVKEKIKGKNVKMEMKETETGETLTGAAKVKVKKGAIKKLSVDYEYYTSGTEYIIEYNVKDKTDPELLAELNLTPEQAAVIEPGHHKIVSTSPYTAGDIDNDFRTVIIKDIQQAAAKKKK